MKKINLTNMRDVVLVDDADYDFLSQFSWYGKAEYGGLHAVRSVTLTGIGAITVRMHRLITEADKDQIVKHINGNTLDNRRANLQLRTLNPWSGRPEAAGYRGVNQIGASQWNAEIEFAGQKYNLGSFDDPKEAAHIYDNAATKLFGKNAIRNFSE